MRQLQDRYSAVFFCDQKFRITPLTSFQTWPKRVDFVKLSEGYPTYIRYDVTSKWREYVSEDEKNRFFLNVPDANTLYVAPLSEEFRAFKPRLPWGNFAALIKSESNAPIPEGSYKAVMYVDMSQSLRFRKKYGLPRHRKIEHENIPAFVGLILSDARGHMTSDLIELPTSGSQSIYLLAEP